MKSSQRRSAFTLVELLVVIGVIALLISILLPSLNKARQFASSIKCASNQRSIGQMFALYANQNKGWLPRASGTYDPNNKWQDPGPNPGAFPNPQNDQYGNLGPSAFWYDFLSLVMQPKRTLQSVAGSTGAGTGDYASYTNLANCGNMAADVSPVFHDTDLPVDRFKPRVSTYYANFRVIAPLNAKDRALNASGSLGTGFGFVPQRQLGSIKQSSRVMMMWCAPVAFAADGSADINQYDAVSWSLDAFCYSNGHYYLDPLPGWSTTPTSIYDQKIGISTNNSASSWGAPVTLSFLKSQNKDVDGVVTNAMRFRHLNNTSINALYVDGHVESRLLGSVVARDVCLNSAR